MKLILSLTLIWAFSSTAGALRCHVCTDVNDLDCGFGRSEECGQREICFNAFIRETDGTQRIYRNCAGAAVCPAVGPQTIAANLGGINTVANAECCDTEDCNLETLTFPDAPAENGIQCPGCDPSTDQCNSVVNCKGEEDTCFQSPLLKDRVQISVAGCGTSNVCAIADDLRILPFLEEVGTVIPTPTCYLFTTTTTPAPTTTTTTPEPTTTTPEPTTTTPEPTTTTPEPTTTTPEPITTTTPHVPSTVADSTTVYTPSHDVLVKIKALLLQLRQLSFKIKLQLAQQQQLVLFQLHLQLLDYQQQLVLQQEELPIDHHHQLPLYYQQCLLVNHHQLLLHQIHVSLCGQQNLLQLFHQQQLVLHQLQELLHGHHNHLLPHYASYLAHRFGH